MTRLRSGLAVLTAGLLGSGQQPGPCDVSCHALLANRAEAAGNYAEYQAHVRTIATIAPSHPGVVYAMARAFARTGAPDSALAWLARLGTMGDTRDPNADSVFRPLASRAGYAAARNRLLSNRLPILDGKVAFEIADGDYVPEALAYDSARTRFLIGSLAHRSVGAFAPNGLATPFIPHTPEILRIVGIHIDAARNRLWFATWSPDSGHYPDSTETPSITRLFLADPASGRIMKSWVPNGGKPGHLLNDFVVMTDGSLFLTDTDDGLIYHLRSPSDTLEVFLQPDAARFTNPNGITSTPDGRILYVGFLEGVARLDVGARSLALVPAPDSVSTAAVDGLYWYRGSLIAVQHMPTLEQVSRYALSADGHQIVAGGALERGLPVVHLPTTGTFVGSRFYYVANSQYTRLDGRTSALAPPAGSVRTAIRVIELRP